MNSLGTVTSTSIMHVSSVVNLELSKLDLYIPGGKVTPTKG